MRQPDLTGRAPTIHSSRRVAAFDDGHLMAVSSLGPDRALAYVE